jgi:hypothetical protein
MPFASQGYFIDIIIHLYVSYKHIKYDDSAL